MMTNPQKGAWDEHKNMAGTKWVAVRNIPQENLLGEKIGFFTRPILIYPCGEKYLTQRSRPPVICMTTSGSNVGYELKKGFTPGHTPVAGEWPRGKAGEILYIV